MVFQQLKHPFVAPDYTIFGTQMQYGSTIDGRFEGIEYLLIETNADNIWQVIPEERRAEFFMTMMRVNTVVPPHTDSGIKSTINFYIRTDDCVTQFYQLKTNTPTTRQVNNQTDGHIIDIIDLDATESFCAEPNTAWLLDVTQPHAVIPKGKFSERRAIVLSSKLPYSEVADLLRTTGNL